MHYNENVRFYRKRTHSRSVACKMSEVEEKKNFACLNGFLLFTLYVRDLVLSINCSHSHSILFSTGLNDLFQPCSTDAHEKNI